MEASQSEKGYVIILDCSRIVSLHNFQFYHTGDLISCPVLWSFPLVNLGRTDAEEAHITEKSRAM